MRALEGLRDKKAPAFGVLDFSPALDVGLQPDAANGQAAEAACQKRD